VGRELERLTVFDIKNHENLESVCKTLRGFIEQHHQIYDLPVLGEYWENLLSKSLRSLNIENDWTPDLNHVQGVDLIIDKGLRVSCKTGQVTGQRKNNLKFSGSRMTKHLSLKEKLCFLSEKRDDVYMLLSRSKKEWEAGEKKYYFIAFPSNMLQYSNMEWKDTFKKRGKNRGTKNGHRASSETIDASISFAMSHQLWTIIKDFKDNENIFVKEISV